MGSTLSCPTCEIVCMFSGIDFVLFPTWKTPFFLFSNSKKNISIGTTDYRTIEISDAWKKFTTFLVINLFQALEIFLKRLCSVPA
jgi:hypothetical protein